MDEQYSELIYSVVPLGGAVLREGTRMALNSTMVRNVQVIAAKSGEQAIKQIRLFGAKIRQRVTLNGHQVGAEGTTILASSPAEIYYGYGSLSVRQQKILNQLPEISRTNPYSQLILRKSDISVTDLAALTAKTGDEFALFTRGSQRLVIRGNSHGIRLLPEEISALHSQGYRWSAHSHPGTKDIVLDASGVFGKPQGDRYVLELMKQDRSLILNSAGHRSIFDKVGDQRISK